MEIILTILIGILLLAFFIFANLGLFVIFEDSEHEDTRKGCGIILILICVLIALLCGARSCVS